MKACVLLLPLFIFVSSSAQVLISGKVVNQSNRNRIAYANIGIVNTGVGTISNEDGTFSLQVPLEKTNDTLLFSAIGFGKRKLPIPSIAKRDITIYLKEQVIQLKEVSVVSKKEKNKIFELGNRIFNGGVIQSDTTYAGASMSLLVENKNPIQKGLVFPVYLEKAQIRIFRNNLKSLKMRVRLYEVDSTSGGPGKDITNESIVVESSMRNGWLEFDLSHLKHQVSKPFFIAFEQLLNKNDRTLITDGYRELKHAYPKDIKVDTVIREGHKTTRQIVVGHGLDLPGTFIGIATGETARQQYTCYNRNTSFDRWKKVRGILTATVTVSNQLTSSDKISIANERPCQESTAVCQANQFCKDFLNDTNVNGLQLCISVNGKIKLSQGFGLADVENNVPVTTSTKFRIYSISKAITSTALIKLMSENKLDLDAPVQKYVPSYPVKKFPVTTRQLAGHLAGFRDYYDLSDFIHNEHYENLTQAVKIFENDSLLFEPGSQFHYSTFGWNLIGAVIERVSGVNYLDYMQENIWHHAGDGFNGSSHLIIYPDDDIVIAYLANSQEGVWFDVQKIGELFYSK